jgi:hypothetical protein
MQVIRWPELDILESDLKIVDEFYTKTNKGPILTGLLFPISQMDNLREIKQEVAIQKKRLLDTEALIYKVSRDFNK